MESNQLNSPKVFSHKERGKYNDYTGQKKRVYKSFSERPKTMLEVAIETNILRANICRYIAKWKKQNKIELVKFGICPITKHRAGFYHSGEEAQNGSN